MTHNMDDINIIKLKSVSNEIELGMIRSILDDNDIPYLLKIMVPEDMRIIAGGSIFGTDVMVEKLILTRQRVYWNL